MTKIPIVSGSEVRRGEGKPTMSSQEESHLLATAPGLPAVLGRRRLLRGAAAGAAALAAAAALPVTASAGTPGPAGGGLQVSGVSTVIETSHASPEVVRFFGTYFRAKSARDVDGLMAHFADRGPFRYMDAVLGASLDYEALHKSFAMIMPTWHPGINSYATRIVGDQRSAVAFFDDVAGVFGARELRVVSAIDLRHGKIVRQVDYWDSRHSGIAATRQLQTQLGLSAATFPTNFWVSAAGEQAAPRMQRAAYRLNAALAAGDGIAATALFAPDGVYEDNATHLQIAGRAAISHYLRATVGLLPYGTPTTRVRHVLGSGWGGGYEWKSQGDVPRGLNVLELDDAGSITRLTAMWDGAFLHRDRLRHLMDQSIEQ